MESGKTGKYQMQRRRFYLEDRLEDIDSEMERFRDEAERLKGALAAKPQGDALTKAQRRLNYVRERSVLLRAERKASAEERTSLIRQLRETDGNSA